MFHKKRIFLIFLKIRRKAFDFCNLPGTALNLHLTDSATPGDGEMENISRRDRRKEFGPGKPRERNRLPEEDGKKNLQNLNLTDSGQSRLSREMSLESGEIGRKNDLSFRAAVLRREDRQIFSDFITNIHGSNFLSIARRIRRYPYFELSSTTFEGIPFR